MIRFIFFTFSLLISIYTSYAQSSLNSLLETYHNDIKVCNAPHAKSCIYETNYVKVSKIDNILTFQYGFSYDKKRNDYISRNIIKVDLTSATFCTGFWHKMFGEWQHHGDKSVITITDDNGIDQTRIGAQSYNQGTQKTLLNEICFSFGSIPLANKVLKELLLLQKPYKESDPWLIPHKQTITEVQGNSKPKTVGKTNKKSGKNKIIKSKSGKYGL